MFGSVVKEKDSVSVVRLFASSHVVVYCKSSEDCQRGMVGARDGCAWFLSSTLLEFYGLGDCDYHSSSQALHCLVRTH